MTHVSNRSLARVLGGAATVVAVAVAAVVVLVASGVVGGSPQDDYTIPGVDSQVANDLLTERFPDQSGATARIVVHRPEGITSDRLAIASMIGRVAALPHVVAVSDPFDPAAMTPEERDLEVAAILATGYLRLRRLRADSGPRAPALPLGSPEKSLEQPGDQAPPCPAGERPPRGRARKEVRK